MSGDEPVAAGTTRAERDEARRRRAQAVADGRAVGHARADDRPPAPWGRFPLSELCVLLALILGIAGLVVWGDRGRLMVLAAMALGSLAGLELSIREHFAGYRSHSAILAGATAIASVTLLLVVAGSIGAVVVGVVMIVGLAVFAVAFYGFRELFKSRSGGLGFR